MSDPSTTTTDPGRHRWWKWLAGVVAVPGLVGLAAMLLHQWHGYVLGRQLNHPDPGQRAEALAFIAREKDRRFTRPVRHLLGTEQDRGVLEAAGYAAMRLMDVEALPALMARAEAGPDDPVRMRLTQYAARLSNLDRRLTDWLLAAAGDHTEPCRQTGGAIGLLEIADPRGGPIVLRIASDEAHPGGQFAFEALVRIVRPMTETVGLPISWPASRAEATPEFWADLERFWERSRNTQLLADVLNRRYAWDPRWYEINRLVHARNKVARWFD